MKRYSTERLFVAVGLGLTGALISVLIGLAEVGLFVTPWVVLCALGLTQHRPPNLAINMSLDKDRIMVGDTARVTMIVDSSQDGLLRLRSAPAVDVNAVGPNVAAATSRVESVHSDSVVVSEFEFEANEWGTHDLGRFAFEFIAPYGLFRMVGRAEQRTAVRVHPTPRQLDDLLAPWMVRRVTGAHRSRESAQGIEYADIRPFVSGDSVRDINWRASARSPELWVSQRHPDRATDVVLLVDSFVETGHDVRNVFGLVIESALALAQNHLAATDRVGMVEFGGLVRWVVPGTGSAQLQRLTDALLSTGLYANAAHKDLPALPARALPPRSFVVAFTPLLDERFIEAIFTARARGHDVAVIECAPPAGLDEDDQNSKRAAMSVLGRTWLKRDAKAERSQVPKVVGLSRMIWDAERAKLRDEMAEQGIAIASWDGDQPLALTLGELLRRRRQSIRVGARR